MLQKICDDDHISVLFLFFFLNTENMQIGRKNRSIRDCYYKRFIQAGYYKRDSGISTKIIPAINFR